MFISSTCRVALIELAILLKSCKRPLKLQPILLSLNSTKIGNQKRRMNYCCLLSFLPETSFQTLFTQFTRFLTVGMLMVSSQKILRLLLLIIVQQTTTTPSLTGVSREIEVLLNI